MNWIMYIMRIFNFFNSPSRRAFIAILLWSTQAVFLSYLFKKGIDFSSILLPSFLSASFFLLMFKILYDKKGFSEVIDAFSKRLGIVLLGILLVLFYHVLLFWGLQIGPKVETNLVNFLWPLLFIILGHFILKNEMKTKCDKWRIIKITIGFIGILLILTHGNLSEINLIKWHGPLMGFGAAISWAVFSIYLKKLGNVSYIATFIGGTTIFAFVIWIIRNTPEITLITFLVSIYIGFFPLGLAMIAWERAMKNGQTAEIGMLAFLAPLFSTIFLFAFKFDYLNWYSIIGGGMVVFANVNVRLTFLQFMEKLNRYFLIRI